MNTRAGQPAEALRPHRRRTNSSPPTSRIRPRCLDPHPARRVRHQRPPRLLPRHRVQRHPHPATTQAIVDYRTAQGITVPVPRRDTHGLSRPAERPRSRCWSPTACACSWTTSRLGADARAQPRDHPHQHRAHLDKPTTGPGARRHRRHPVAQPAPRRRLQVQPAARRPGRHRRHRWIADRANELIAGGVRDATRFEASDVETYDFRGAYVADLKNIIDVDAIARRRAHRRRPAGRREVEYWGRSPSLRTRPHRREPRGRPDAGLHDAGLGRKIRMDLSSPSAMASLLARQQTTTSSPATTPTPTGTASSRPTAG
jgi:phosphoglucomutase